MIPASARGAHRRSKMETSELAERIVQRKRADPELTAVQLAARLQTSHVLVLRVLREAGLVPPPVKRTVRR